MSPQPRDWQRQRGTHEGESIGHAYAWHGHRACGHARVHTHSHTDIHHATQLLNVSAHASSYTLAHHDTRRLNICARTHTLAHRRTSRHATAHVDTHTHTHTHTHNTTTHHDTHHDTLHDTQPTHVCTHTLPTSPLRRNDSSDLGAYGRLSNVDRKIAEYLESQPGGAASFHDDAGEDDDEDEEARVSRGVRPGAGSVAAGASGGADASGRGDGSDEDDDSDDGTDEEAEERKRQFFSELPEADEDTKATTTFAQVRLTNRDAHQPLTCSALHTHCAHYTYTHTHTCTNMHTHARTRTNMCTHAHHTPVGDAQHCLFWALDTRTTFLLSC
jgi:hypothetical protein